MYKTMVIYIFILPALYCFLFFILFIFSKQKKKEKFKFWIPAWSFFRTLFWSRFKYVTYALPLLYTYIIFSEHMSEFFSKLLTIGKCDISNAVDFYEFLYNGHCGSKYFLYFSFFSLSFSSILYAIFCPAFIRNFTSFDHFSDYYLGKPYLYIYTDTQKYIKRKIFTDIANDTLGPIENDGPNERNFTTHQEKIFKSVNAPSDTISHGALTTKRDHSEIFRQIQNEERFIKIVYETANYGNTAARCVVFSLLLSSIILLAVNSIFYLAKIYQMMTF